MLKLRCSGGRAGSDVHSVPRWGCGRRLVLLELMLHLGLCAQQAAGLALAQLLHEGLR